MTDITSEKWLWIKGGLFVVIAFLSLGLLLIELTNVKQVLLVLLSIWAFCRAYYFAFYVIEKYIDGDFRFAGLIYLPKYMFQRWTGSEPAKPTLSQSGWPSSWYVFWSCVFLVSNFFGPSIYSFIIMTRISQEKYIMPTVTGAISTQVAFLAVVASFSRVSLKFSIPIAYSILWLLTTVFLFGCEFVGEASDTEQVVGIFLFLSVLLAAAIGQLLLTKSLLGFQLCDNSEMNPPVQVGKKHKQLTILYLLTCTVAVALLCLVIKATKDGFRILADYEFLVISLGALVGSLPAAGLLILVLRVTLSTLPHKEEWKSIPLIAVGIAFFPFIAHGLIQFPFSFHGRALPAITTGEILQWYCFVGGFVTSLCIILLHARSQGIRLKRSSFCNHEN